MAVTITDNRTQVDGADSTTGWSNINSGNTVSNFTSNPTPVELAGCNGIVVSNTTEDLVFTISSTDLTGTLIYVWALGKGVMDTKTNSGIQLAIGDGTDTIGYDNAGADVAVFRHSDGQVDWQCLVLDTANLPAGFAVIRGVEANLTLTAITELGANFTTTVKSVGGVENCFCDQIRYGNGGIDVLGGTSGARGTFLQVATEDRDNTSTKAYGILRELAPGSFGAQGRIDFGETGTATHYFKDTNFVVTWEERGQASARYGVTLQSNGTGVGSFELGEISGSENGQNGGTLIMPASSGAPFDASDATLDFCQMYDTTLKNWTGAIDFSNDATNGLNHDVFDCAFDTCGTIDIGRVDFVNNTVINSAATSAMTILNTLNTLWSDTNFISDGTGHAIRFRPTGAGPFTYTINDANVTGYAVIDGSTGNEVLLIDPVTTSADITITKAGGTGIMTVMEAAGYTGTFTLLQSVNIDITVTDQAGDPIENARVAVDDAAGTQVMNELTNASGFASEAFTGSTPNAATIFVRKNSTGSTRYVNFSKTDTISTTGLTLSVTMLTDNIASA